MLLERLADALQLVVRLRHLPLQLRHRLRRAHARDNVLPLRVDQELAVELLEAVRRVARESHARSGPIPRVAIDHRLHVDRRAPFRRDVVLAAVNDRAIVHPRPEHGADGPHQLVPRRIRELLAGAHLHQRLEAGDQLPEIVNGQPGILDVLVIPLVLDRVNHHLERVVILVRSLLDAEDDVPVHLHEPAVAVPREARVAGPGGQRLDGLVVQAEIQDRVHHPGHRVAGARAHGHEQRVVQVAEFLAGLLLDRDDARFHLRAERRRIRPLVGVVVRADLGGDGEAGRHRQSDAAHLSEVRALAAEQRLHRAVAVGLAAKEIDVLALRAVGARRSAFGARRSAFGARAATGRARLRLRAGLSCELLRHMKTTPFEE